MFKGMDYLKQISGYYSHFTVLNGSLESGNNGKFKRILLWFEK